RSRGSLVAARRVQEGRCGLITRPGHVSTASLRLSLLNSRAGGADVPGYGAPPTAHPWTAGEARAENAPPPNGTHPPSVRTRTGKHRRKRSRVSLLHSVGQVR